MVLSQTPATTQVVGPNGQVTYYTNQVAMPAGNGFVVQPGTAYPPQYGNRTCKRDKSNSKFLQLAFKLYACKFWKLLREIKLPAIIVGDNFFTIIIYIFSGSSSDAVYSYRRRTASLWRTSTGSSGNTKPGRTPEIQILNIPRKDKHYKHSRFHIYSGLFTCSQKYAFS